MLPCYGDKKILKTELENSVTADTNFLLAFTS
jgi:hypothetical protein